MDESVYSVSDFVALLNQALEFTFPIATIEGEITDYRGPNRNGHHYFTLKDEQANLKCVAFAGTVQTVIEEGMQVVVKGSPNHHPKYGFSFVVRSLQPSGEGALKRAFLLLKAKLEKEGLFDAARKRPIPNYPTRIGVISSSQAAGYKDFIKILNDRWRGVEVLLADVQVQGDPSPGQIVRAFEYFNQMSKSLDVLVLTRGGGSPEDLQAFNNESVVRAVVASRIPTVVAVGHEIDTSLADLAADVRAATPSEAAQLVVPEISVEKRRLQQFKFHLSGISLPRERFDRVKQALSQAIETYSSMLKMNKSIINSHKQSLVLINPRNVLKRGFAIARLNGQALKNSAHTKTGDKVVIQLHKGSLETEVTGRKT